MPYRRFEQLVISLGAVSILGALVLSLQEGSNGLLEISAQLLLLGVLMAAVHWGRRGGTLAALAASLVYVAIQIPVLSASGLTTGDALVLVVRIATFGLVGIVGGEVCARIKYVFARYDDSNSIDEWSRVYNQRYAALSIERARERYARYGEPFVLVLIRLSNALTADLTPSRQRTLVRAVASHLRNDVRMVDEVSRLDDGRFCILLPHTPHAGGVVVMERVVAGVRRALGAKPESVLAECLGAAEDTFALSALTDDLRLPEAD